MGILDGICTSKFKASKSDKILIEYINENAHECVYMSISELARLVSLGEATITRFTRKLGFSGYQEFKLALAKQLTKSSRKSFINTVVSIDEPVEETAQKLFVSHNNVLEETLKRLDYSNVIKIRELILNCKRLYFFGIGNSGIVANDGNYKFMRIGINSIPVNDSHTMMMLSSIMERGDVVFAISHTGETREILKAVELAKQRKAKVISLTESRDNKLKELSDINLSYFSKETLFETGSILSKFVQIFLLELIYAEVIKENYDEAIEKKVSTTNALEKFKELD